MFSHHVNLTLCAAFTALAVISTAKAQPPAKTEPPKATAPAVLPLPAPPSWGTLQSFYQDNGTAPTVKESPVPDAEFRATHLSFTDAKGETVSGTLLLPSAKGVYPVVLLLHGLGSDKEAMLTYFGREITRRRVACLALDAPLHGERKQAGKNPAGGETFVGVVQGGVRDWRQAVNYLKTRKDLNTQHIGLLGYSMGAMMGSILAGVDTRISDSVLCVGGDPLRAYVAAAPKNMQPLIESASPSNYAGHITPRQVFFINGTQDATMPEAAARRLQNAAKEPKKVLWVNSGHIITPEAGKQGVDWLLAKISK